MGQNPPYRPICEGVDEITVNNVTDEAGWIKIFGKDADALILGDATHEGGDISVYRNTSGNKQLFVDADAVSNAIAMSVYGGVVAQHYLTVGQAALNTTRNVYVAGSLQASGSMYAAGIACTSYGVTVQDGFGVAGAANAAELLFNIVVEGTNATDHAIKLQIDVNDIIVVQATGNGSGGIDAATRAIGVFGVTPQVQQAHIADVAAAAGDPPTKAEFDAFATKFNTLLADQEGFGFLAAS